MGIRHGIYCFMLLQTTIYENTILKYYTRIYNKILYHTKILYNTKMI